MQNLLCHNPNVRFMIKCGVQGHLKPRKCVWEWNTLSQVGEECKRLNLMAPKCTPTLKVVFLREPRIFKALVKKANKHQIKPQDTIEKVLKCRCLKCSHIIDLNLKCMSYDQKNGWESNWEFDYWPKILLEQGSNHLWFGHAIHHWKDLFKCYKILPFHAQNKLDLKKIWVSKVLEQ